MRRGVNRMSIVSGGIRTDSRCFSRRALGLTLEAKHTARMGGERAGYLNQMQQRSILGEPISSLSRSLWKGATGCVCSWQIPCLSSMCFGCCCWCVWGANELSLNARCTAAGKGGTQKHKETPTRTHTEMPSKEEHTHDHTESHRSFTRAAPFVLTTTGGAGRPCDLEGLGVQSRAH